MILFFNPTITQTVGPTGMNMTVGAEYAINQLKELYDFNKIFRSDLNFRYYIENQFPQWIQDQAKKDSDVKIIDLIQEFYNFYFSSNGLNLYPNYEYIQSVFFSNQDGLRALYSSLFSDFDFDDFISSKEEELVFAALNHDLGKIGNGEQEGYLPQTDNWRRDKLKDKCPSYKHNMNDVNDNSNIGDQVVEYFTTSIDEQNHLLSEDYHFCKLARDNGIKVWGAAWAQLGHTGTYQFSGRLV